MAGWVPLSFAIILMNCCSFGSAARPFVGFPLPPPNQVTTTTPIDTTFPMLPKGFDPPSGPSNQVMKSPPPPDARFPMLPKGFDPPSLPSNQVMKSPPPPDARFPMLPKGFNPPSLPSNRVMQSPPPPDTRFPLSKPSN